MFEAVGIRYGAGTVQPIGKPLPEAVLRGGINPAQFAGMFSHRTGLRHGMPPRQGRHFPLTPFPFEEHRFVFPLQYPVAVRRYAYGRDCTGNSTSGKDGKRGCRSLETGKAPETSGAVCVMDFYHIKMFYRLVTGTSVRLSVSSCGQQGGTPPHGAKSRRNVMKVRTLRGAIPAECI